MITWAWKVAMQNHAKEKEDGILERVRPFFLHLERVNSLVWKGKLITGVSVYMKGSLKKESLRKQIYLSHHCSDSFITFIPFPDGDWLKEDGGLYFACMKTMKGRMLNYSLKEDRLLAIEKVAHFHQESIGLVSKDIFPVSLTRKWTNRLIRFKKEVGSSLISANEKQLIQYYISVGEEVISGMTAIEELERNALRDKCIVHGDPAHHNFIFRTDTLLLIDGDLANYAPHEYDFLQLMNRMLSHCNWSLDEWSKSHIPTVRHCLENPLLCRLLAYPADFYREWLMNPNGRSALLVKVAQQNDLRSRFINSILK